METIVFTCGVWPGNMSLRLFALPEVTSARRTVTWISYTLSLLPGTIIRRARTSSTPPSSPAPGIRTSIKGEKHGRFLSLRCHIINSGVSGMFAVVMQVDWRNRGSEECTRDGASQFTESGRSISRDRGSTPTRRRNWVWRHLSRIWRYSQRWILRRDSSRQNIPIMEHYK